MMSENKKLVPKRRFKEFKNSNAWEQRKLLEMLVQSVTDGPHETPDLVYEGITFISVDAIVDNKIDFTKKRGCITKKYYEECCKKYKPEIYDVYLVKSGSTVGKVAIVETNEQFNIWSPLAAMRCGVKSDPYFLYYLLQTTFLQNQIFDKCSHGTQPNLSMRQLEKFDVVITNVLEQKRIGKLFQDIDNLITLHQRKLEKLKALKAAYLSELFPAEGERKPKRRFKGFTNDWEQCKWEDIFTTLPNNSLSRAELNTEDGLIKNVHYGDVLIKYGEVLDVLKEEIPYISNQKYQCNNAALLQNGDVIIADAAEDETVGKCSEIAGLSNQKILSGLHTIPCRPIKNFSRGYLGYYMNSGSYHDQLLPLIQGTKISSISKSALKGTNIIYPNVEEQEQIGAFFTSINNLITLHQRNLEKLQNIKDAYLNEMFVGGER